jgi:hypothetical protein
MLQDLIKDLQSTLKNYSKGLANKNLLVDIPWTMVDGDLNLQRLIFRKDNSLYIVREGEIQESKWEYLPAMSSLIIEIGGKKMLMNEVFADGKALILKKDGLVLDFLAFANQNELPNLNLVGYLKSLEQPTYVQPTYAKSLKPHKVDPYEAYIAYFIIGGVILLM